MDEEKGASPYMRNLILILIENMREIGKRYVEGAFLISHNQSARLLSAVVRSLRKEFPDDFSKRCNYAAFAMRALLSDVGVKAEIVGGDFVAFVLARDGRRAGMQGFGDGKGQCAHFWVEAEGHLFDVGPHLLPNDSSYTAVPMPLIAWEMSNSFPAYIRYRQIDRFAATAAMSSVPEQNARCDRFIAACRSRVTGKTGPVKPLSWLLTGPGATEKAARERDDWARGALRFDEMAKGSDLPF